MNDDVLTGHGANALDQIDEEFSRSDDSIPRVVRGDNGAPRIVNRDGNPAPLNDDLEGIDPNEMREAVSFFREVKQREAESQAAIEFMQAHPDYKPTPQNSDKLLGFLSENELPVTRENLETAYEALKQDNSVERIRKPFSGIPDRSSRTPEPKPMLDSDIEGIREMSLDDARDLVLRRLAEARRGGSYSTSF